MSTQVGLPDVVFMKPGEISLAGKKLSFGALQHVLTRRFKCRSIAIGYTMGSEVMLGPNPETEINFGRSCRIITITRSTKRRTSLFAIPDDLAL